MNAIPAAIIQCPHTRTDCSRAFAGSHPACVFPLKGRIRRFDLHETIFQQETGCRGLYCLRDGLLALRRYYPDGRRAVVRMMRPGEIFGWADAFITGLHRWEGWTLTAGSLWTLPAADWMAWHPDTPYRHMLTLAYAESQHLENAVLRSNLRVEDRMLAFLLSLADRSDRFPVTIRTPLRRADLAEVVAITPESCSRVMKRLQKLGMVYWHSQDTIVIHERAAAQVAGVVDLY